MFNLNKLNNRSIYRFIQNINTILTKRKYFQKEQYSKDNERNDQCSRSQANSKTIKI